MTQYYIGISALHHDSAASLVDSKGNILCVSQEERRSKIKNDKEWPEESIKFCKNYASINHLDLSSGTKIGYYEKPWLKFTRRLYQNPKDYKRYFDMARSESSLTKNTKRLSHHKAHALAGCATSPFDECVYLIVDAMGEWNTTSWGSYNKKTGIKQSGTINYPHSLGVLYSAFTRWLGLKPNEDEHIIMGAAAYGKPEYWNKIFDDFIEGYEYKFKLKKAIHNGIEQYYGDEVPVDTWYDWCASIQFVSNIIMNGLVLMLQEKYGENFNLVLGGGVALNCSINSKILENQNIKIKDIWILPSPGDSGSSLGAAAHVAGLTDLKWCDAYLGKDIDDGSHPTQAIIRDVVARLDKGEVIGWIQGREEFGPRSLGHRALLADPRNPNTKDKVNKIKNRQEFRPFAPSVIEVEAYRYFDMPGKPHNHRYMQFVSRVRNPDMLPAICHVDNTARVQTVPKSTDPFSRLLEHWYQTTGCAVLLNTSLNVKGQPLISDRKNAIQMLLDTSMDALIIGNRLYFKKEKPGISEIGRDSMEIAEFIDYSGGIESQLKGRI